MKAGRRVSDHGEQLVHGLTHSERLQLVESTLDGDKYHDGLVARVQALESVERRRAMPWWVRWMVTFRLKREIK